jgi:hypothetical protein
MACASRRMKRQSGRGRRRCCIWRLTGGPWPWCMQKRGSKGWAALGGVRPTCLPAVFFFAVWRMPLLHRTNSWFYRLLHMWKRGSTCFLHICISSLSLWTSLLLYYMQPYGLISSVLHFIKRAMLKVLSWGQSRLKKNRMKKPVRQWKLREFGFFFGLNGMKDDSSRMTKSVVHQKIWLEANCVFI